MPQIERKDGSSDKIAHLPQERCTEAAPFTYCGVDMFWPFIIKTRRSGIKCYAAFFTCFSSHAVRIKVTSSLDADSFFPALQRFMSRRGLVSSICSDNTSNYVGPNNELKTTLKGMKHGKVKTFPQENSKFALQDPF